MPLFIEKKKIAINYWLNFHIGGKSDFRFLSQVNRYRYTHLENLISGTVENTK